MTAISPRQLLAALLAPLALMLAPLPAAAQDGEFGEIFEDIFGQIPNDGPMAGYSLTTDIPLRVEFDAWPNGVPDGAMLVMRAEARPAPNERWAAPRIIGESKILMDGITSGPVDVDLPVSALAMKNRPDPVIEVSIVSANGDALYAQYGEPRVRGRRLMVELLDVNVSRPADPYEPPVSEPYDPYYETIKGRAATADGFRLPRRAVLVAQVIERGLAGGPEGPSIAAEERILLEGRMSDPTFEIALPRQTTRALDDPALRVWIEDEYGERLYQMPRPLVWDGDTNVGALILDPVRRSDPWLEPGQDDDIYDPVPAMRTITGEARFDAWKSLPRGSRLIIKLGDTSRADAAMDVIATEEILLDGLSGYIDFEMQADSTRLDRLYQPPTFTARIVNADGEILFYSDTVTPLTDGENIIRLRPTQRY